MFSGFSRAKIFLLVALGAFLALNIEKAVVKISSGETGVLWKRFDGGTQLDRVYGEGWHITNPFNRFDIYDTQEQKLRSEFSTLSKDGLQVTVSIFVRFSLVEGALPVLQNELGPDYLNRVVIPEIQSTSRRVFGQYEAKVIRETQIDGYENMICEVIEEALSRFLELADFEVLEITFPGRPIDAT
ncbi:MAG: prohibitin family protein [Pseudomonadota bacterium]